MKRDRVVEELKSGVPADRGYWACEWCQVYVLAGGYKTLQLDCGAGVFAATLCNTCVRHINGITCAAEGLDPTGCPECCGPNRGPLADWDWDAQREVWKPGQWWIEEQRRFLDQVAEAVLEKRSKMRLGPPYFGEYKVY